jgi:hypothetical protein
LEPFTIFALFLSACGAVALGAGCYHAIFSDSARARRQLRRHKAVAIKDAPEAALVKIVGTVSTIGEPLEAPLSGQPCAAWMVSIEEIGSEGGLRTVLEDVECRPFYIDDGTGKALVRPSAPRLSLVLVTVLQSQTHAETAERLQDYLENRAREKAPFHTFQRPLQAREGIVEAGELVAVIGVGRLEVDASGVARAGYRDAAKVLVLEDPEHGWLAISDDPTTRG